MTDWCRVREKSFQSSSGAGALTDTVRWHSIKSSLSVSSISEPGERMRRTKRYATAESFKNTFRPSAFYNANKKSTNNDIVPSRKSLAQ